MEKCYLGIEGGGTKFVCGIGSEAGRILERVTIPTTQPAETLENIRAYYLRIKDKYKIAGVGVGCFGPLDLDPASDYFGYITSSPKTAWTHFDIKGSLEKLLGFDIKLDTDVNAALLSELRWGAGLGLEDLVYLTVGTGIGGGVLSNGKLLHGMLHPEIGHILISNAGAPQEFRGVCFYHEHCLEGLASGPAIEAIWGTKADELSVDHPAWDLEALMLARGIVNVILMLSPQKIILGGGVMNQTQLFPLIHKHVRHLLNGYVSTPQIMENIDSYIVPTSFGNDTGLLGTIALAID